MSTIVNFILCPGKSNGFKNHFKDGYKHLIIKKVYLQTFENFIWPLIISGLHFS
ncbi:hypothetical protein MuYL_2632 [Mucilaginibacter xinganensis]|uniref:Uncharacterized protein n=1 Tax=Mucilaginibacter xinganensis TaxID=1234841 RepID=A0A223NXB0_9SPHI|nr:hypothetical protein MuYL_2632 [Mucilaginibacter xinganensis]